MLVCEGVERDDFKSENENYKFNNDEALRILVYKGNTLLEKYSENLSDINFKYDGKIFDVECYCNLYCGNIEGDAKAGSHISCGNIKGDAKAGNKIIYKTNNNDE